MMNEPAPAMVFTDTPQTFAAPQPRSGNRRSRRRWVLAGLALTVLLFVAASAGYARLVYFPSTPSGSTVGLTVAAGASVDDISRQLHDAGLVSHPKLFQLYLRLTDQGGQLQAGNFLIPENISMKDLVQRLGVAEIDQITLRFAEGWRREEMAAYIGEHNLAGSLPNITADEFSALALHPSPALRQKLGRDLPADASLQGFLFPDTYQVHSEDTAEDLLGRMIDTYQARVTPDIVAGWQQQGLTPYQAVNLAAIVEREARAGQEERSIIAGILLKRLAMGIPLGVDATLQYALGYSQAEQRWWRQAITVDDLVLDSPYNTRKLVGLPPRPICNPGLEAMHAVAHPQQTEYLFYLHGHDGQVQYARTQAEHDANIAQYLQ